jgi:AcrR family transcriptional regulator
MTGTVDGRPTRRPGGRTARVRAQILAATAELVARDGIAGFRYEEVAELAGVHRTSVYRNWPDREELIVEALLQYVDDLGSIADTGELRTDLADFLMTLAESLDRPTVRALERAIQATDESPAVHRTATRILEGRAAAMRRRLDLAIDRGELPPVDYSLLGEMITGPVHLIMGRAVRRFTRTDAERIVDVVLAGVRATAPHT